MVLTMSMVLTCALLSEAEEEEIARKNSNLKEPEAAHTISSKVPVDRLTNKMSVENEEIFAGTESLND